MLLHEGAYWEKFYCLVGMACQIACHPVESTQMLTKTAAIGTHHSHKHLNKNHDWNIGISQNNYSNIRI